MPNFSTSNVCFGSIKFYLTGDVIHVHGNIDGNQDKSGSIKFVSDSTGFPRFFPEMFSKYIIFGFA